MMHLLINRFECMEIKDRSQQFLKTWGIKSFSITTFLQDLVNIIQLYQISTTPKVTTSWYLWTRVTKSLFLQTTTQERMLSISKIKRQQQYCQATEQVVHLRSMTIYQGTHQTWKTMEHATYYWRSLKKRMVRDRWRGCCLLRQGQQIQINGDQRTLKEGT